MRKQIFFISLFVGSLSLFNVSCHKDVIQKKEQEEIFAIANNANNRTEKKIYVLDVVQLYDVVNDPSNAGSEITLSPGIYMLSSSYPNGGRLELQADMELRGQPGHPKK
jgi:hypothetical protein